MEYQVPQFIEVEDKIFGPFTLKQFIYLAGGIGISVVIILYVKPLVLALLLVAPIGALTAALAFYRVNNKPFIEVLEAGFNYYTKGRLYLWKKEPKEIETPTAIATPIERPQKLGLTRDKLHDLAWSLDVQEQNQNQP